MNHMIEISDAIFAINPSARFTFRGHDVDTGTFEWLEGTTPISKADIKAKISALDYKSNRQVEYPSIADQLDDIYHNGIDGWKATIKVTKDKYPKGD